MKPLTYGHQSISQGDVTAVTEALTSEWLTTGPRVTEFEKAVSAVSGAAYAVSVTSGTAALHVAYAACRLGPGSRLLTSPLTFVATASTAVLLGAEVRFVDVEDSTGCLDPGALASEIRDSDHAVCTVDFAGRPSRVPEMAAMTKRHGVTLLEDAAHSIGSELRGRPVGSLADVTTFSFFATKNVTTAEGGAVVTDDRAIASAARAFRNHGLTRDPGHLRYPDEGIWHQEVHAFGLNYRLPDVLAALGASQLRRIHLFRLRRQHLFDRYQSLLADIPEIRLPEPSVDDSVLWHLFPIRVPATERRRVFDSLRAEGIYVQVNYVPVYWHPVFEDMGYKRGICPQAERWYREEISLPLHVELSDSDQDRVVDAVRRAFGHST